MTWMDHTPLLLTRRSEAPSGLAGRLALVCNLALAAAWLWLHAATLAWLALVPFAHARYRLNLLLLFVAAGLILARRRARPLHVHTTIPGRINALAPLQPRHVPHPPTPPDEPPLPAEPDPWPHKPIDPTDPDSPAPDPAGPRPSVHAAAPRPSVRATVAALLAPLTTAPRPHPLPLAVCLGAAALHVISEQFVAIHSLQTLLFGLGTYGLISLYRPAADFARGLPAALLLIAALPFGAYANTYIGLFVRMLTAEVVGLLLHAQHVAALSAQTILVLEGGVAHIDVPCSGLRSLWAGALFFVAATWIDRRPVGRRWLLCAGLLFGGLFCANVLRVYVLVVLAVVAGQRTLAELVHEPLGVLGFLAACGAAYLALRSLCPTPAAPAAPPLDEGPAPRWLAPSLLALLLGTAALHTAHPPPPEAGLPSFTMPAALGARPAPLTDGERALFARFGARAEKWHFTAGGRAGSLIAVSTTSWRAQHPPELCLSAAGLRIDAATTHELPFPARVLTLREGDRPRTAVYWFQSRARTTADFVTRAAAALRAGDRRWVMVSILFDGPDDPAAASTRAVVGGIHDAVARGLTEGARPSLPGASP